MPSRDPSASARRCTSRFTSSCERVRSGERNVSRIVVLTCPAADARALVAIVSTRATRDSARRGSRTNVSIDSQVRSLGCANDSPRDDRGRVENSRYAKSRALGGDRVDEDLAREAPEPPGRVSRAPRWRRCRRSPEAARPERGSRPSRRRPRSSRLNRHRLPAQRGGGQPRARAAARRGPWRRRSPPPRSFSAARSSGSAPRRRGRRRSGGIRRTRGRSVSPGSPNARPISKSAARLGSVAHVARERVEQAREQRRAQVPAGAVEGIAGWRSGSSAVLREPQPLVPTRPRPNPRSTKG